jgi:hypothetical protein
MTVYDVPPEDSAWLNCPYCGSGVELLLDPGGGPVQRYVEDCEVCCRPWQLRVQWDAAGHAHVEAGTEDDTP